MKPNSIGPPVIYLGNKVSKVTLENGNHAWAFSSSQYVQDACSNVKRHLMSKGKSQMKTVKSPCSCKYQPKIDILKPLSLTDVAYFQSLIGILRWIVELGRVDIAVEVSMLALMMALPRQGHLEEIFHIFSYLSDKHNVEMVFDLTVPDINDEDFPKHDWSHTPFSQNKEPIPDHHPKPRGFGFHLLANVDSDHAGDSITRQSRTGFIVYCNSAPIYWYTKKQRGIKTSSFSSEFMAMKTCCEYLRGL